MRVTVCSVVYGRMEEMFNKWCLPSISEDIKTLGAEVVKYGSHQQFLQEADQHEVVFYTSPDHVWSKGSIVNLAAQIEHLDVALAVPHIRVDEEDFLQFPWECKIPIEAPDLVKFGLKHAHQNFKRAYDTLNPNACHHGISVRQVSEKLTVMRHNLPSVSMLRFNKSDTNYFNGRNYVWGEWDRGFLNKLWREDRLKIVGSSDMAFTVEQTQRGTHPCDEKENRYNDKYERGAEHSQTCRTALYVMRSS